MRGRGVATQGGRRSLYPGLLHPGRPATTAPYEYSMPKPKANLRPGELTEGVVIFGCSDPAKPLEVTFSWERRGLLGQVAPAARVQGYAVTEVRRRSSAIPRRRSFLMPPPAPRW